MAILQSFTDGLADYPGIELLKRVAAAVVATILASIIIRQSSKLTRIRHELRGLRPLGLQDPPEKSHKQPESRLASTQQASRSSSDSPPVVEELALYAIKSCAQLSVAEAHVIPTGFAYDRLFAFAAIKGELTSCKSKTWTMLSQREYPRMALIKVEVWVPDPKAVGYEKTTEMVMAGGCLRVSFRVPSMAERTLGERLCLHLPHTLAEEKFILFHIPLLPVNHENLPSIDFKLHSDVVSGIDVTSLIPSHKFAHLRRHLGINSDQGLALLRYPPEARRALPRHAHATTSEVGFETYHGFTDQAPLHLLSFGSIQGLQEQLPQECQKPGLDATRFRANIYLGGCDPWTEESWSRIRFHSPLVRNRLAALAVESKTKFEPTLRIVCRTTRCKLPNVEPVTGTTEGKNSWVHGEPQNTMLKTRKADPGKKAVPVLGVHAVPELFEDTLEDSEDDVARAAEDGKGTYVRVGDEIEVLERCEHVWGKPRENVTVG